MRGLTVFLLLLSVGSSWSGPESNQNAFSDHRQPVIEVHLHAFQLPDGRD
jgi:hypothetical protein